jgi:hypothetical protein
MGDTAIPSVLLSSCVVILFFVWVSSLVYPRQSVAASEASKEKLRVRPQTDRDDDFHDNFLFRSKIPSRLYVPDFARVN